MDSVRIQRELVNFGLDKVVDCLGRVGETGVKVDRVVEHRLKDLLDHAVLDGDGVYHGKVLLALPQHGQEETLAEILGPAGEPRQQAHSSIHRGLTADKGKVFEVPDCIVHQTLSLRHESLRGEEGVKEDLMVGLRFH